MNARAHANPRSVALMLIAMVAAVVVTACSADSSPAPEPTPLPTPTVEVAASAEAPAEPAEVPAATPTAAPASTPVAAAPVASPSALRPIAPTTFLVGNTLGRGMMMRREPVPTERGTVWPEGTKMEGLGAERDAYGWTWVWIRDPNNNAGWMPTEYLTRATDDASDGDGTSDSARASGGASTNVPALPLPSTPTRLATPPAELPFTRSAATTMSAAAAATTVASTSAAGLASTGGPTSAAGAAAPAASASSFTAIKTAPGTTPAPGAAGPGTRPISPASAVAARPPAASTDGLVIAGQTVVASGRSSIKTKPFALAGGSYTVAWQARGSGNCIARLSAVDGSASHSFLNVIVKDPERGETQVYGVKPGQYYLDMTCSDWAVVIVPQGQDALAALDTAPVPPAIQPTMAPAASIDWALAFDRVEPMSQAAVSNEYGNYRKQVATGVFQRIYFRIQNRQKKSDTISASELTLTDAQGRAYSTDFQVRQVQAGGSSAAFDDVSIVPDATVGLSVVFDVSPDASGLVLHMRGGNDVKVN